MKRNPPFSPRLTENECANFARSFSVLLAAGWTIQRILEAILKQTKSKRLSGALSTIKDEVQQGASLAEAMRHHETLFGSLTCAVVAATEPVGALGNGFAKCADYYEKASAFHMMISRKLRYPMLVTIAATGVIAALFYWFIPDALARVSALDPAALPLSTRIILMIMAGIHSHGLVLASLAVLLLIIFSAALYLFSRIRILARGNWNLPFLGGWLRQKAARRFLNALSTMTANNVPAQECLQIALTASKSNCLAFKLAGSTDVPDIVSLINLLDTIGMLPDIIIDSLKMARTGESFAEAFKKASAFYQEKLEALSNSVLLIVEPVVVAILGLAGATILVALYLPYGHH